MKSLFKILNYFFVLFVFSFFTSCSSKIDKKSIKIVKPPKWTMDLNNDGFSAIGISNGKIIQKDEDGDDDVIDLTLGDTKRRAEENAIENLRLNLLVKLESFFIEELSLIKNNNKSKIILKMLNDSSKKTINVDYLKTIIRQDEMWRSPDSGMLYVKIVVDRKQIASKLLNSFDKLQSMYSYDDEIVKLFVNIKNDMLYNNFKTKTKNDVKKDNYVIGYNKKYDRNSNEDNKKDGDIIISNVVLTKSSNDLKERKKKAKKYFDVNGDGQVDYDEINQRLIEDFKEDNE